MITTDTYQVVNVTPDTPEWEEERRHSLGASEVAAVLGLSPYATPLSVFRSKMGVPDDFDPELAYIGHAEENVMEGWLRRFRPEIGEILPAQMIRSIRYPWLHASLDRRVMKDGLILPIQMKTAHAFARQEWADGVPLAVQVQVQTEIAVFDVPAAYAVAFVGGRGFHLHPIERDDEFIERYVLPKTLQFWEKHVLPAVAPDPSNMAELADVFPSNPEKVIAGSELVLEAADRRAVLLSDIKEQTAEADALQLVIGQYMEDAELLTDPVGNPILSFKTQKGRRKVTDLDELEIAHPEFVTRGADFKTMRTITRKDKSA